MLTVNARFRFDPTLTCDADLGRPFGGAVEHALFDLLHVGDVGGLGGGEHLLDEFEDLWLVPLADLHAVFENHDDVLGSVLRAVFGALLCCSWVLDVRAEVMPAFLEF
ncbi:hypothetical protein EYF80_030741 [Liparis tanakae]|uniref:Uncharacterized protein n=1 Tax=Liparis tanakae TaxID=230148 RepID=A0A4Z2H1P5_9TELE|nr:hypothetical protein EYF80_030741 [Liparis tanakae]